MSLLVAFLSGCFLLEYLRFLRSMNFSFGIVHASRASQAFIVTIGQIISLICILQYYQT